MWMSSAVQSSLRVRLVMYCVFSTIWRGALARNRAEAMPEHRRGALTPQGRPPPARPTGALCSRPGASSRPCDAPASRRPSLLP
jgi:hypothetical protein